MTTPTTALRDVIEALEPIFVAFDKNGERRMFHMRETAERHAIGGKKVRLVLDGEA
jgi:hypothetical protein